MLLKAGICVAYDWELLKFSLPAIYHHAVQICLSVDSNAVSWSGNEFLINKMELYSFVQEIDREQKITILEESFYSNERSPIENECYQRRRMAEHLGKADWIIQIDADEILINGKDFIEILQKYKNVKRPVNIHGLWANLIKQTKEGFIYSVLKTPPLATNRPVYEYGRTNGHFNIYTNVFMAHITWARSEKEVHYKLHNWGHSHEFNGESFFKIWQALDDHNWKYIKDFHPMTKESIPQLFYQQAKSIDEFRQFFNKAKHSLSRMELSSNNIWVSRFRKLFKVKSY